VRDLSDQPKNVFVLVSVIDISLSHFSVIFIINYELLYILLLESYVLSYFCATCYIACHAYAPSIMSFHLSCLFVCLLSVCNVGGLRSQSAMKSGNGHMTE